MDGLSVAAREHDQHARQRAFAGIGRVAVGVQVGFHQASAEPRDAMATARREGQGTMVPQELAQLKVAEVQERSSMQEAQVSAAVR